MEMERKEKKIMGKCKDCKYYRKVNFLICDIPFGDCDKLYELNNSSKESEGVHIESQGHCLQVGANFGCIHFERREKQDDKRTFE